MASILIALRTFVSISQVLAVVWLLKVAEKVTSECDTQDKWGGRVFVSEDSTVSLCAWLALSVPARMPLKHVKLPSSHWGCVYYRVTDTGLASGSSRAVNPHWLTIVLWPIMVVAFFAFYVTKKKKKKPDLILNLLYYLKYCDWLAQVESSLH